MSADDVRDQAEELHGIADEKGHGGQGEAERDDPKENSAPDGARDVRQSIHEAYEE